MVAVKNIVKKNLFRDSVQLLHLSEEAKKIKGVLDAAIVMGTDLNKELLRREGLLTEAGEKASENDMIVAVKAEDSADINVLVGKVEELLTAQTITRETYFYSVESAIQNFPEANLALISVPGEHAKEVAIPFIRRGIHIHLFSDHVPLEDEVELKRMAAEKGLLVMGPEAGTSIINGVAIAFANAVNRGPIGIIAAAGTGLQEVSVLISRAGSGITQGIGVGGRDVKSSVGGVMTLMSLKALEIDESTKVITVISKPPSIDVQNKIVEFIAHKGSKRYVTCFVGGSQYRIPHKAEGRLIQTRTLHAAALESLRLISTDLYEKAERTISLSPQKVVKIVERELSNLRENQRYVRGLFTGGTLMYESMIIFKDVVGDVWSNAPLNEEYLLPDPWRSREHSMVDLGGEEFTSGRAHPMIDPTIRLERLISEVRDDEVSAIMMDFVLGYGSHPDPAGAHLEVIRKARELAAERGQHIALLAHVVGTQQDPQRVADQERKLREAGVIVLPTNALMAITAAMIAARKTDKSFLEGLFDRFLKGVGDS